MEISRYHRGGFIKKLSSFLTLSPTMKMSVEVDRLRSEGYNVISLAVGESHIALDEKVKAVALKTIDQENLKYTSVAGLSSLRKLVAQHTNSRHQTTYGEQQVVITPGSKFGLYSVLRVLDLSNAEVLVPTPCWPSYETMIQLSGAKPQFVESRVKNQFKVTADEWRSSINSNTGAIIINSPSNPTGQIYEKKDWQNLVQVLRDHPQVWVLCDDIYNEVYFEERVSHLLEVAPDLIERVFIINGASKAFSMTGWRLGWVLAPQIWCEKLTQFQSQTLTCAPYLSQVAAEVALRHSDSILKSTREQLQIHRDLVTQKLKPITSLKFDIPQGGLYFWMNIGDYLGPQLMESSEEFCLKFLKEKHVALTPGSYFSKEGYIRFCFSVSLKELQVALTRLTAFLKDCKSSQSTSVA